MRIVWYLACYHDIKISGADVSRILKRNGPNRLPRGTRLGKVHTTRDQQQVPGHQIQVAAKFLIFRGKTVKPIKRYRYTAIDDASRVRALEIYNRHTQANTILFFGYILKSFSFRIRGVRTRNGHEFQVKLHWHVEDQGIRHACTKPSNLSSTARLNTLIASTKKSSTNYLPTRMTSIASRNSLTGSASTMSQDPTAPSTERHHTKLSQKSYNPATDRLRSSLSQPCRLAGRAFSSCHTIFMRSNRQVILHSIRGLEFHA